MGMQQHMVMLIGKNLNQILSYAKVAFSSNAASSYYSKVSQTMITSSLILLKCKCWKAYLACLLINNPWSEQPSNDILLFIAIHNNQKKEEKL